MVSQLLVGADLGVMAAKGWLYIPQSDRTGASSLDAILCYTKDTPHFFFWVGVSLILLQGMQPTSWLYEQGTMT